LETELLIAAAFIAAGATWVGVWRTYESMKKQNETAKTSLDNQVIFKIFDILTENDFRKNRMHVYNLSRAYRKLKKADPKKDEIFYIKSSYYTDVAHTASDGTPLHTPGKEICRLTKGDFGEIASILKLNQHLLDKVLETWGDTISLSWRALEPEIKHQRNEFDPRHFNQFEWLNDKCEKLFKEKKWKLPPLK